RVRRGGERAPGAASPPAGEGAYGRIRGAVAGTRGEGRGGGKGDLRGMGAGGGEAGGVVCREGAGAELFAGELRVRALRGDRDGDAGGDHGESLAGAGFPGGGGGDRGAELGG